jgi:hypothetical protein
VTAKVASIYFEEKEVERPLYSGKFKFPAVAKGGKPFILTIPDHHQSERMPYSVGGGKIARLITGQEIAHDIVQMLAHNGLGMSPQCGPGIWQVREFEPICDEHGVPQKDFDGRVQLVELSAEVKARYFAEDQAEASARQIAWADYLVGQGDMMDADPQQKLGQFITPAMRLAAAWSGLTPTWNQKSKTGDSILCPYCGSSIRKAIAVCPICQNVVDSKKFEALKKQLSAA